MSFLIGDSKVKIITGRKSQTVNVEGSFLAKLRIKAPNSFITEKLLVQQKFSSVKAMVKFLKEQYKAEEEIPLLNRPAIFKKAVQGIFQDYRQKIQSLEDVICNKQHPDHFLILVSCYLDTLVSLTFPLVKDKNRQYFGQMLKEKSDIDIYSQVCLPELHQALCFYAICGGTYIDFDGEKYTCRSDDKYFKSFLSFLKKKLSLASLDEIKIGEYLDSIRVQIEKSFAKKGIIWVTEDELRKNLSSYQSSEYWEAFSSSMINPYFGAEIFYREFRCEFVHQPFVNMDFVDEQEFWEMPEPYLTSWNVAGEECQRIVFSAPFLLQTLYNCLDALKNKMLKEQKLPPEIWKMCFDEAEMMIYMDQNFIFGEEIAEFR